MKDDNTQDEVRINTVFAQLFACCRPVEANGESAPADEVCGDGESYVSRESYLRANPESRRKICEFALHFDPRLLQSIKEWESAEGVGNGFSRIEARARFIMRAAYRNLRGHQ